MNHIKLFNEKTDTTSDTISFKKVGKSLFTLNVNGEKVGSCNYWIRYTLPTIRDKKGMYIHSVEIVDKFRNQGYGKILIKKIIEFAKNNGYYAIYLEVVKKNEYAVKLYQSLNFKIIEELNKEYKTSYDMILVL